LKKLWFRLHSTPKNSMFFTPITASIILSSLCYS
jgi:hypothetical protein